MKQLLVRLAYAALALLCVTSARALGELPAPGPTDGTQVKWSGWTFRWAVRPREGLILTDVWFQGRKVMKYAGLQEIFVPYDPGQPRPEDALDGMGQNLRELIPGKDCLPGISCAMFDREGKPSIKPVVAMHEEVTGLNYVGDAGRSYGKMLVLWCASQLGDYTYFIRWRFRDDGAMMPQVGLTGKLSHTRPDELARRGTIVSRKDGQVFAPSHVHNFYYRLDLDIDGAENDSVEEFNHEQDAPKQSFASQDEWRILKRECARPLDGESFRSWRVVDRASRNGLNHPRSYELMPGGNGVFRGAANELFTHADFWVAKYKRAEFPLSSTDPRSVKDTMTSYLNDESVDGQDVVLWYAMHVHHLPRTEDWPQMPVQWAGFELMPRDFLDTTPISPKVP